MAESNDGKESVKTRGVLTLTEAVLLVLAAAVFLLGIAFDIYLFKIPWYWAALIGIATVAFIIYLSQHPVK